MDDCCAVCAEPLEWVAYGSCGHREVCSTCVVRLRFVLGDNRCCLCKNESPIVFVTKALGDYTRTIGDFSIFPSAPTEGQVGSYWYHEDTQSYFDDVDHYKMIKAMCKLSCNVCEKYAAEEQGNEGLRRRDKFKNIEQLKKHLFHRHRLFMCDLCLEGRKIFICEQKLYTRSQLNQHTNTGDSEVDGSESERGGFMGHPKCDFCRKPFYGDNELYLHMSTEHYTCHICQRLHPGQYDYFKNYDDLEIHFRNEHFLCENEACLAKKFVVFVSEPEMKRHNAIEHGGHMSRSKRNAALQIPTSFRYRRNNENDQRRGRGRGFHSESSDSMLSMAIQASLETANANGTIHESSSSAQAISVHGGRDETGQSLSSFETLAISSDPVPEIVPSRYLQAVSQTSGNATLQESSFPPLPVAPKTSKQKIKLNSKGSGKNSMAAHLRLRNQRTVTVLNSPQTRLVSTGNHVSVSHSHASSSRNSSGIGKVSRSVATPTHVDRGPLNSSMPQIVRPISGTDNRSLPTSTPSLLNVEDVQTANKSLVERIRISLGSDESKFTAFKDISARYRQDRIDTKEYLAHVRIFGLSHLILELARLCPDPLKQKELIETYNASSQSYNPQENSWNGNPGRKQSNVSKGKEKRIDGDSSSVTSSDSILNTVKKLQANNKPWEVEEVEVLSKDGYRTSKGNPKVILVDEPAESASRPLVELSGNGDSESHQTGGGSKKNPGGGGNNKQKKKTSKFHRVRLGDGSAASLLDRNHLDPTPEHLAEGTSDQTLTEGLPVRGVWRTGAAQRLFL